MSTVFSDVSLGITTPMANEIDTAEKFVLDVLSVCREHRFQSIRYCLVFYNTCTDGTYQRMKNLSEREPALDVIFEPQNTCVVDAYFCGYRRLVEKKCDWILEIDAGYSHLPKDISGFFKEMAKGYDCVFGSRFAPGGSYKNAPLSRYVLSKWGSVFVNLLLGTRLTDMTSGFELFTLPVMNKIVSENIIKSHDTFFQTEIKYYCHKYSISEVPIHYSNPSQKSTGQAVQESLKQLMQLYIDRIKPPWKNKG